MLRASIGLALLLAACSDDTTDGGGGAAASGGGEAPSTTSTAGAGGAGGAGGELPSGPGAGGEGAGGTTASAGGGGAGGEGLAPWEAPIERCDGALDDDGDGRVDEDCPPSLFSGVFVPAGTGLADPTVLDHLEADAGTVPVIQTYRSTSAAGAANARADLAAIWARGSVAHLNVEPSGYTPAQYAAAGDDPELAADVAAMAAAVAESLADDPDGRVLLTFGAEMNGDWVDWGCLEPATFIAFYRWAHGVFADHLGDAGVDRRRVRWVFGPNNVSSGGCGSGADYYPGHAYGDLLGMSSYRSGTQSIASAVVTPAYDLLDEVGLTVELRRDRFVVLQTGTRDEEGDDRDGWIRDLWTTLEGQEVFAGVIYFDAADWSVVDGAAGAVQEKPGYEGLVDAIAGAPLADARLEGTFEPFFWDVAVGDPSYPEIQSLRAAGLTAGCDAAPPRFCPDVPLARADAAVLLARAFDVEPLTPASPTFGDVGAEHPAHGHVEALFAAGVLEACGDGAFCPTEAVTRVDLARALVRLAGVEDAAGEAPFADLLSTGEDGAIQVLAEHGLVDGCFDHAFCPDDDAQRAVGARWIARVAGVPAAPPL